MFKNSGLLHVATRLVKIIVYLLERSSSLGKVQATDFVEYSLLKAVINQYKNMYPKAKELEQSAIIALFNYSGEDNPNGYLKINKGFGCLVHCIILLIPHGFDVNDIMISGMNRILNSLFRAKRGMILLSQCFSKKKFVYYSKYFF